MKHLVRVFAFHVFALWLTSEIFPAFIIAGAWQQVVFAGFMLSILTVFVQPLLKILFIPINVITFGLLSWLINVIVLYLLTVFVPEVQVTDWIFPGYTWLGFVIPSVRLSYTWALITATLFVTLFSNTLHRISEE